MLARATPDSLAAFALKWEAPGTCPTRSAFEAELRRDLAGSQAAPVALKADVSIVQLQSDRFRVAIRAQGPAGASSRSLEATTCGELVRASSLIIATLIDPEGVAARARAGDPNESVPAAADASSDADRTSAPSSSAADATHTPETGPALGTAAPATASAANGIATDGPRSTATSDTGANSLSQPFPAHRSVAGSNRTNPSDKSSDDRPAPGTRTARFGYLATRFELDLGALPDPAGTAQGALGFQWEGFRVEAGAGWWRPQTTIWGRAPNPQAGGEFSMIAASMRGCIRVLGRSWLDLFPCAGFEYRSVTGRANGAVAEPGQATRRGMAPTVALLGTVHLVGPLAFAAGAALVFPLDRPVFTVEGLGDLHQPSWIGFRAGIGLELRFP